MKILISDSLSEEGIEILKEVKDFEVDVQTKIPSQELKELIKDYDVLIVRSGTKVTREIIENAKQLKIIGRAGVGLDNVDLETATKRGIIVMNTPGGNTISTAEHTMSLLLSISRNIPQADASIKANEWERSKFMGVEVYGKTLGIIGLGRIGSEVCKRAISFGMKIIAYDPFLPVDKAKELGAELVELDELYRRADYITIHTPLTDQTKYMINEATFKKMKKGVRIINCARGGIVDEQALAEAIDRGIVAGAALDVYENEPPKDSPLLKFKNVVLTPHLGASTEEAQINVAIDIAESVRDALLNRGIRNAINVPCVEPELCKLIEPYIQLAERMGCMVSQIGDGHIKALGIKYSGDIANLATSSVTVALVKGMLTPVLQETVNYVNALIIAKERGIIVNESKSTELEDYTSLITAEALTDKGRRSITGTLFTKRDPRIVKIDQFHVDAVPEGYMIVAHNIDVPGIIGQIGSILGRNNINIATMTFGRETQGGKAISVLNVDSPVPEAVLEEIRRSKNILDARLIKI